MKKTVLTLIALAITMMANAFSFSAPAPTGQTLYYTVIGTDSVKVVAPAMNWNGYAAPAGALTVPATVDYEGVTYRVISIGQRAFFGDTLLTAVRLDEGVEHIDMMAFNSCTRLDSIALPSSLTRIAMSAFDNTAYFNNLDHWIDSMMLTVDRWVVKVGNRATDTLWVPEGMAGIANSAFLYCRYMAKVVLPSTLRYVGDAAFKDCLALDTVEVRCAVPPLLSDDSFEGVVPLPVLVVPCEASETYDTAACWSAFDRVVELPCPEPPIAVEEVEDNAALTVTLLSDGVLVRGGEGMEMAVVDVMGRHVSHVTCALEAQRLPLPAAGVYLLRLSDGRTIKASYSK